MTSAGMHVTHTVAVKSRVLGIECLSRDIATEEPVQSVEVSGHSVVNSHIDLARDLQLH